MEKTVPITAPQEAHKLLSARDRIFAAASELFYRRGIRAVGVETIAEAAQTTKMSLYRSFPSKDALVAAWLQHNDEQFCAHLDGIFARHAGNPRRQIESIFESAAAHMGDPGSRGCPFTNAGVELTDAAHPARPVIDQHKAHLRARLLLACRNLGAAEPSVLADSLFLLLEGMNTSLQTLGAAGPGKSALRAAQVLIDSFIAGPPEKKTRRRSQPKGRA